MALKAYRFYDGKYGKVFQMISKIKNPMIVSKQPLRDGSMNHVLAVFVKLIYRTYLGYLWRQR